MWVSAMGEPTLSCRYYGDGTRFYGPDYADV
jgi:hypothetical protein